MQTESIPLYSTTGTMTTMVGVEHLAAPQPGTI
jgi:hypothetical protein